MIPEQERTVLIKNWVHTILKRDASYKYFDIIERLWESSGLTNRDLVDALMSERENKVSNFKDSIFGDMVWLLTNTVFDNAALRSLFSDLYAKRYPKVDNHIKELESNIANGRQVQISMPDMMKYVNMKNNDTAAAEYFVFRVYNSDIIVLNDCVDPKFWKLEYEFSLKNLTKAADAGDDQICFADGLGDEVFSSVCFKEFVAAQRQALAAHLKIEPNELAEYYDKIVTVQDDGDGYGFAGCGFGLIPSAIMEMIWLNGGNGWWLNDIQSQNHKNKYAYGYRPDFDKLFERYCRASVRMDHQVFTAEGVPFTHELLENNCAFVEMEALAVSMGYLYTADCVYQLFKQMQKQYYEDFSWEKYRNKDLKSRYENVISDLNTSLAIRDKQFQNLRQHYTSLKKRLEKKNDLALLKELQDKERLLQISDEKDAEIERLKAVIASQNQLIEQLQAAPEEYIPEVDTSRFDVDAENIVYQHKYLFVGDIANLGFEELRRKFPSSVFMESNTTNISQIQVDAVVYLIQSMGHSMYYKCKNTAALKDAKIIYFNGRGNVMSLLKVMESAMLE